MRIIVGQFGHSYGIKGWLKVHSLTDPAENILQYLPWQIQHQTQWGLINVTHTKLQGNNILAKIAGCDTPEAAKLYANDPIAIEREQLPPLTEQEYYWTDLIGLKVINQDGVDFGVVDSLFATGSNDVLVVNGERKRLLPYTAAVIINVDLSKKILQVMWDADF